mmetsp:Transcript_11827/g.28997  ORF Transcript_11827/g.28997 Transcript_11827/m.28997 type:complete len:371 (+) Transcript_11827:333-1445(+)
MTPSLADSTGTPWPTISQLNSGACGKSSSVSAVAPMTASLANSDDARWPAVLALNAGVYGKSTSSAVAPRTTSVVNLADTPWPAAIGKGSGSAVVPMAASLDSSTDTPSPTKSELDSGTYGKSPATSFANSTGAPWPALSELNSGALWCSSWEKSISPPSMTKSRAKPLNATIPISRRQTAMAVITKDLWHFLDSLSTFGCDTDAFFASPSNSSTPCSNMEGCSILSTCCVMAFGSVINSSFKYGVSRSDSSGWAPSEHLSSSPFFSFSLLFSLSIFFSSSRLVAVEISPDTLRSSLASLASMRLLMIASSNQSLLCAFHSYFPPSSSSESTLFSTANHFHMVSLVSAAGSSSCAPLSNKSFSFAWASVC